MVCLGMYRCSGFQGRVSNLVWESERVLGGIKVWGRREKKAGVLWEG